MLSDIRQSIEDLDKYPEFGEFYQAYIKTMQDDIISNELAVNRHKVVDIKSFNRLIVGLNTLTEEMKIL